MICYPQNERKWCRPLSSQLSREATVQFKVGAQRRLTLVARGSSANDDGAPIMVAVRGVFSKPEMHDPPGLLDTAAYS